MVKTFDVLGVKVAVTTLDEASRVIASWVEQRQKTYVCVAPVSTIVDCQKDEAYRKIVALSDSDLIGKTFSEGMSSARIPGGMGRLIVFASFSSVFFDSTSVLPIKAPLLISTSAVFPRTSLVCRKRSSADASAMGPESFTCSFEIVSPFLTGATATTNDWPGLVACFK